MSSAAALHEAVSAFDEKKKMHKNRREEVQEYEKYENGADHVEHLETLPTAELPTRLADDVSYGPSGLKGIIGSPYIFGAAFLASLGGFSFGYDQGVISIVNTMPQFHAVIPEVDPEVTASSSFYLGLNTAMLELGAFLGCLFMPWLADRISRKWALSFVVVIFCVGAVIQTACVNYGMLVVGRTIGGIGVGTLALGAPLYIAEISPPQLRGSLLVLESVSIVTGVVGAFWISYACQFMEGSIAFRLPFGLQMVSALLLGSAIHLFPFSPRWLALRGRVDESLESLAKLRRLPTDDSRVQTEWRGIVAEAEFQKIMLERTHPGKTGFSLEVATWLDLFRKRTRRRTAVGVPLAFFQQFSGINGFIYYAPILFASLGQSEGPGGMAQVMSGVLNILQLVAVCVCFFIIEKVGRRKLAIWGGFGMAVPYIIMAGIVGVYEPAGWQNTSAGWATVAMAFIYILVYGVSYSPLTWALPSEVFSTATRSKGVAASTATVWLCNFIVGLIVPPMLESAGFGTYVFFAFWCFCAGVWAYFLVPETKGKTLEQMDAVFGDGQAEEEKEVMKAAVTSARRKSSVHVESRRGSLA